MSRQNTHIEDDVLAVICLEPAIAGPQLLLPLHDRRLGDLDQNRVVQLCRLALLLQLR